MPWLPLVLLVAVVVILAWRAFVKDRREYALFKTLRSTAERQRMYRRWLIEGIAVLGGLAVVTIWVGHAHVDAALRDAQEWPPIAALREQLAGGLGSGLAVGAVIGFVVALVLPLVLRRRGAPTVATVGDIDALLPRNRAELGYGAGLSVNAGVTEELLFRLGIPALLFGVIGDGPVAFAAAAVLFGLLHVYQGWIGVVATTVLGLVLTVVYVLSGSIVLVIVLHVLIDLRALVVVPITAHGAHRVPGTSPPAPSEPSTPAPLTARLHRCLRFRSNR